jgi:hypothetical protein
LDERGHLVEPAEKPDKKDDRDRYADQPEQKTSTQGCLLRFARWQSNVASKFKFPFAPAIGLPRSIDLWSKAAEDCTLSDQCWRSCGSGLLPLAEQTKGQS